MNDSGRVGGEPLIKNLFEEEYRAAYLEHMGTAPTPEEAAVAEAERRRLRDEAGRGRIRDEGGAAARR